MHSPTEPSPIDAHTVVLLVHGVGDPSTEKLAQALTKGFSASALVDCTASTTRIPGGPSLDDSEAHAAARDSESRAAALRLYLEAGDHLRVGELLAKNGDHEEAILHFENARAWVKAAESSLALEQHERAARFYERGAAFDRAATCFEKAGESAEAKRVLERQLEEAMRVLEHESRALPGRTRLFADESLKETQILINARRAALLARLGQGSENGDQAAASNAGATEAGKPTRRPEAPECLAVVVSTPANKQYVVVPLVWSHMRQRAAGVFRTACWLLLIVMVLGGVGAALQDSAWAAYSWAMGNKLEVARIAFGAWFVLAAIFKVTGHNWLGTVLTALGVVLLLGLSLAICLGVSLFMNQSPELILAGALLVLGMWLVVPLAVALQASRGWWRLSFGALSGLVLIFTLATVGLLFQLRPSAGDVSLRSEEVASPEAMVEPPASDLGQTLATSSTPLESAQAGERPSRSVRDRHRDPFAVTKTSDVPWLVPTDPLARELRRRFGEPRVSPTPPASEVAPGLRRRFTESGVSATPPALDPPEVLSLRRDFTAAPRADAPDSDRPAPDLEAVRADVQEPQVDVDAKPVHRSLALAPLALVLVLIFLLVYAAHLVDFLIDVLWWVGEDAHRVRLRAALLRAVDRAQACFPKARIVLLGHSLGSVVVMDALRHLGDRVSTSSDLQVVTMGSPLAYFWRLFPRVAVRPAVLFREIQAAGVSRWLHVWRSEDKIGLALDMETLGFQQTCAGPGGHSEYWIDGAVWQTIAAFLRGEWPLPAADATGPISAHNFPVDCWVSRVVPIATLLALVTFAAGAAVAVHLYLMNV